MLHVHYLQAAILILAVSSVGCGKGGVGDALNAAKGVINDGVEQVKQVGQETTEKAAEELKKNLNLVGSFDLTAGGPLKTQACYVRIIPQAGRPTVLQLQSYLDADSETFPSAFLQAQVTANSLEDLVGEPLTARLFLQKEDQGPVLFSDVSTPVSFKITSVEDQVVSFELTDAVLRDTSSGADVPVTGSMTGVFE